MNYMEIINEIIKNEYDCFFDQRGFCTLTSKDSSKLVLRLKDKVFFNYLKSSVRVKRRYLLEDNQIIQKKEVYNEYATEKAEKSLYIRKEKLLKEIICFLRKNKKITKEESRMIYNQIGEKFSYETTHEFLNRKWKEFKLNFTR